MRYRLRDGVMRVDVPRGEPTMTTSVSCLVTESGSGSSSSSSSSGGGGDDIRDLSGVTDAEEADADAEAEAGTLSPSSLPPLRWEGPISSSATATGVPRRVLGYLLLAQEALHGIMDSQHHHNINIEKGEQPPPSLPLSSSRSPVGLRDSRSGSGSNRAAEPSVRVV